MSTHRNTPRQHISNLKTDDSKKNVAFKKE